MRLTLSLTVGVFILLTPFSGSAQTVNVSGLLEQIQSLSVIVESLQAQIDASDSTESVVITNDLYVGVSDTTTSGEVSKLQIFLRSTGDYTYPDITGYFGLVTRDALKRYQSRNNIVSSGDEVTTGYGFVGPNTRAYIQKHIRNTNFTLQPTTPAMTGDNYSCFLNRTVIFNGTSRTFFSVPTADTPDTCGSKSQIRTCTNGILSGDAAYKYNNCSDPLTCSISTEKSPLQVGETLEMSWESNGGPFAILSNNIGLNRVVAPTGSRTADTSDIKPQTIDYRLLTLGNERGTVTTCTTDVVVKAPSPIQSCTLDGVTIADGTSRNFFSKRNVTSPNTCVANKQNRTCNNGVLSGSNVYNKKSCSNLDVNTAQKPNIIYILLDDAGYNDFTDPTIIKPNIERFATESTRFEQFYTNPMCTPTRMSLLSGNWALKYGIQWVCGSDAVYGIPSSHTTLPSLLKSVGYKTASIGKWHSGQGRPEYKIENKFDYSVKSTAIVQDGYMNPQYVVKGALTSKFNGKHASDVNADYVIDYLKNKTSKNKPFFINYWLNAPHSPHQPSARWASRYGNPTDKPTLYKALYSQADENIGRVLDFIDSDPYLKKNTIVLLGSDNGGAEKPHPKRLGGNGAVRGFKTDVFEGGIRLPLYVRWPERTQEGVQNNTILSVVDILPTLAELAGATAPSNLPGKSFAGIIKGTANTIHRATPLFWSHKTSNEHVDTTDGNVHISYAVRDGKWKLVYEPLDKVTSYLFNMDRGIKERGSDDISASNPAKTRELEDKYLQWYLRTSRISTDMLSKVGSVTASSGTYAFSGSGGAVNLRNKLAFNTTRLDLTFIARITPSGRKGKNRVIARHDSSWELKLNSNNNLELTTTGSDGTTRRVVGSTIFENGETYDVAFSLYAFKSLDTVARLYSRKASGTTPLLLESESEVRPPRSNDNTVTVGAGRNNSTSMFIGVIKNVRMYKAPLTSAQILHVASSGSSDITSCSLGGSTVRNGSTVTAYATATVPFGNTCTSQRRTCNDGTLSGSYKFATCSIDTIDTTTINISSLNFSKPAQRVAIPKVKSSPPFEEALSNPHIAKLNVNGTPYVYVIMRAAINGGSSKNELQLARIHASRFSSGDSIAPWSSWERIPSSVFAIKPPPGKGVLGASIVAVNNKLLVVYKEKLQEDVDGRIVLVDPARSYKTIWNKRLENISGFAGPGRSTTGLTRVTQDALSTSGNYFKSNKGRVIISFGCREGKSSASACLENGVSWNGFAIQEITLNSANKISFLPVIRVFNDETPSNINPSQWLRRGGSVFRKQNFGVHNGGSDKMIFSVNYNRVGESDGRKAGQDYPRYASFFEIPNISSVLDKSIANNGNDITSKMPAQRTWRNNLVADSAWDHGAQWHNTVYIDVFNRNKVFSLYESWGAEYPQLAKTRNSLYPGSSRVEVKSGQSEYSKSCNQICGGSDSFGGGVRKKFCLSASVVDSNSILHGSEILHDQTINSVRDPKTGRPVAGAYISCSDIGSNDSQPQDLFVRKKTIQSTDKGKTVGFFVRAQCRASGAKGYIWADRYRTSSNKNVFNIGSSKKLATGDEITYACSTVYNESNFKRNVVVTNQKNTCDSVCADLGHGDGTGFRPYRSKISGIGLALNLVTIDPLTSLIRYKYRNYNDGSAWSNPSSFKLQCVCGPGRNMKAHMAGKVAD